jgi:membrane protease YdiL (CAAX protease family)
VDLWLLVIILVVFLPALAYWRFTRLARRREPATTAIKLRLYFSGALTQWALVVYCAWVLARRGQTLADIGWVAGGHPLAWVAAVLLTGVLVLTTRRSIEGLAREGPGEFPTHLTRLLRILPTTRTERMSFAVLALTAGFCEEFLYRGFLIYAFDFVLPWTALSVVLAAVAFGIGHTYQGKQGMLMTGVLGIALGFIYVLGGSLWPVILVHAVIDLANGYTLGRFAERLQAAGIRLGEFRTPPAPADGGREEPPTTV